MPAESLRYRRLPSLRLISWDFVRAPYGIVLLTRDTLIKRYPSNILRILPPVSAAAITLLGGEQFEMHYSVAG